MYFAVEKKKMGWVKIELAGWTIRIKSIKIQPIYLSGKKMSTKIINF